MSQKLLIFLVFEAFLKSLMENDDFMLDFYERFDERGDFERNTWQSK